MVKLIHRYSSTALVIVVVLVTVGINVALGVALNARQADDRQMMRCLLVQMSEHRAANRSAHQADAVNDGYSYAVPGTYDIPEFPPSWVDDCIEMLD